MSTDVLRAEEFGRRYRRNRPWAVRDVSFVVPEGAITALVGPNGAGKSTLMRACVAFERPDEGRVLVAGFDPKVDPVGAIGRIGYVPQASSLYRSLTIGDHLVMAEAARPSFDRRRALARIRQAGLSLERVISELSGGEQAQVSLSLALGTSAPLLILDEPLASLDPLARRDFLTTLVADVRERGATVLLSSHIVTDVEQACDRLLVLADGRLLLDSSVNEARRRYRTVGADSVPPASIGEFVGPDGRPLILVADDSIGRQATLEEIVLGHLAAGRTQRLADAA